MTDPLILFLVLILFLSPAMFNLGIFQSENE